MHDHDPYVLARAQAERVAKICAPYSQPDSRRKAWVEYLIEAIALRIVASGPVTDDQVIDYVHWCRAADEHLSGREYDAEPIRPREVHVGTTSMEIRKVKRSRWAILMANGEPAATMGSRRAAIEQVELVDPNGSWQRSLSREDRNFVLARWEAAQEFAQKKNRKRA